MCSWREMLDPSTAVWEATLWDVGTGAARNVRLDEVVGWRGQSSEVAGLAWRVMRRSGQLLCWRQVHCWRVDGVGTMPAAAGLIPAFGLLVSGC